MHTSQYSVCCVHVPSTQRVSKYNILNLTINSTLLKRQPRFMLLVNNRLEIVLVYRVACCGSFKKLLYIYW